MSPKKKKVEFESEDKEIEVDCQVSDENTEDPIESDENENEEVDNKEIEQDSQIMDTNSEEESETEEKIKLEFKRKNGIKRKEAASADKKCPKKIKVSEKVKEKIRNDIKNIQYQLTLSDDDSDDDMELKYESDGSIDDNVQDVVLNSSPNYQLSDKEKTKLSNLQIKLNHEVLPQHKIEKTAGTRALNKEEKEQFNKYAELRTGTFLPQESKILKRNWRDFCIANKWDIKNSRPFLQMRHKNKVAYMEFAERMKFIQCLANGLNNRSLYSVFNRFKVLYDPHKVSRYSSTEDHIIMEFIQKHRNKIIHNEQDRKFAELATILKRTRASVWRRYRVLKKKYNILDDIPK